MNVQLSGKQISCPLLLALYKTIFFNNKFLSYSLISEYVCKPHGRVCLIFPPYSQINYSTLLAINFLKMSVYHVQFAHVCTYFSSNAAEVTLSCHRVQFAHVCTSFHSYIVEVTSSRHRVMTVVIT